MTVYPFDSCPVQDGTSAASPPETGETAGEETIQLVDRVKDPVADGWGRFPGSVFLLDATGRVAYKNTRLIQAEVIGALAGIGGGKPPRP